MSELDRRRGMMMALQGLPEPIIPIRGRTFNGQNPPRGSIWLKVAGNHTYTLHYGNIGGENCIVVYNAATLELVDYWGSQSVQERTMNFGNYSYPSEVYVGCNLLWSDLDNCFLRDETTGEYLWEGSNVAI